MDSLVFEKPEDVMKSMNTGDRQKDLEVINAVLSGNIQIGEQQAQQSVEQPIENEESKVIEQQTVEAFLLEEETERQKRYIELLEKRSREEKERLLLEKQQKEEALALERKTREDLEKRIREIELRKQTTPDSVQQNDDTIEDEFTSDYNKKTRIMVEELKKDLNNNPSFNQLFERINKIENVFESEAETRRKEREKKEKEEHVEKLFNNIRNFTNTKEEYKLSKDIKDVDEEYQNFRKDIAYITNARSAEELELAIYDYRKNGKIKEIAEKNGIKPPADFERYESLADLLDFKNGYEFDPVTGKRVPILDEDGTQIRYRSLEEAYNIKNFNNVLTNVKRQAFKEVGAKLEQFNNAPVSLKNEVTTTFIGGITPEQERDLINSDPREWINNPEKLKLVKQAFANRGLEMPKYRGRQL